MEDQRGPNCVKYTAEIGFMSNYRYNHRYCEHNPYWDIYRPASTSWSGIHDYSLLIRYPPKPSILPMKDISARVRPEPSPEKPSQFKGALNFMSLILPGYQSVHIVWIFYCSAEQIYACCQEWFRYRRH